MTERDDASFARIEATRRVLRSAVDKCVERGATADEVGVAILYATFDVAERVAGPEQSAVEWLRTGCDIIERGLFDGQPRSA